MPLISPNALLYAHLNQSPATRPSNRSPTQPRPINLNIGSLTHCNGSSLIKIGATTIVCGVRAELLPVSEIPSYRITKSTSYNPTSNVSLQESDEEDPYDSISLYNLLVPNIELATGCSPSHPANTAPSTEAQSLSQRVLSLLRTSKLVRTSDLEVSYTPPPETDVDGVEQGPQLKAYWVLYIDMLCISYGGSLFDTAWLALYAALRNAVLPKAWWDADLGQVLCSSEIVDAKSLTLRGMPVPLTFGAFVPEQRAKRGKENQSWVLVDMDAFEEECCEEQGTVTVDLSDNGAIEIVRIEKNGGTISNVRTIKEMTNVAGNRWQEWKSVLDRALKTNGSR